MNLRDTYCTVDYDEITELLQPLRLFLLLELRIVLIKMSPQLLIQPFQQRTF